MEMTQKYDEALNDNVNTLSRLYKEKNKEKIKRLIFEKVDKYNLLLSEELYKKAYLYSCELIKNELI